MSFGFHFHGKINCKNLIKTFFRKKEVFRYSPLTGSRSFSLQFFLQPSFGRTLCKSTLYTLLRKYSLTCSFWNIDFAETLNIYSLKSVNQLESTFLALCQYELFVNEDLYQQYFRKIVEKTEPSEKANGLSKHAKVIFHNREEDKLVETDKN